MACLTPLVTLSAGEGWVSDGETARFFAEVTRERSDGLSMTEANVLMNTSYAVRCFPAM